ncbi:Carboxylic ester hydrolase [Fusarium keratoplasticum]|nr:Carboxylic ester hydrolase [Fusarium keratoplasticum]
MRRIALTVKTSPSSEISMEAWMPRNWTGRFLSVGNGGLGGCISYGDMAYTMTQGFASAGANNVHNRTTVKTLLNSTEPTADFAYRSVHTGVVVGKKITEIFYGQPYTRSYYFGCCSGGRQGFKEAQDFPTDFDGIVAGAPAHAMGNLTSWAGHFYPLTGNVTSPRFVPKAMWPLIQRDVYSQCDGLDGVVDGVIETAECCHYDPSGLVCKGGQTKVCLTEGQAETVRKIYSPLLDNHGSFVYPAMNPGSEDNTASIWFSGAPVSLSCELIRHIYLKEPEWDPATLNSSDYPYFWAKNPLGSTRGMMDSVITCRISETYYEHVSRSMQSSLKELDESYRFFGIGGMNHCALGPGAWNFGQSGPTAHMDADHNVLAAIVRWVEQGIAPETLTGTKYINDTTSLGEEFQRKHCRYPLHNVYRGGDSRDPEAWSCVE